MYKRIHVIFFICLLAILPNDIAADPVRALHVVLDPLRPSDVRKIARMAAKASFNVIILDMGRKVAFHSFPGVLLPNAWSIEDFVRVVRFIRKKGLDVIPAIPLLTHQERFFLNRHPELMWNQFVYNPSKLEVYRLIEPYLNEVISAVRPTAIHIGHDEVGLRWNKARGGFALSRDAHDSSVLPASLFLKDVLILHDYLKSKGVKMWMWGDMLVSPEEFPAMLSRHLHGIYPGYGKPLRLRIPKDIVICDWHYWDAQYLFPTVDVFRREGFAVVGATWRKVETINNFSNYARMHGAIGMIETTWFDPRRNDNIIVHRWGELERLIFTSGEIFLRDFPDAK